MYRPEELNDIQKQAVLETEGAVLVTAGAGSGKTRLLTHRIVHLIKDLNVAPYSILAITFTNKAANEMRERLMTMTENTDGIWIFTFHAACVRILRRFIDKIGFGKNFTIYGDAETKSVVKRICKENEWEDDMQKRILSAISDSKNKGISPDEYESVYKYAGDAEQVAKAYAEYQRTLKANNALDYDDLLIETLRLLRTDDEAREFYQNKFRYIHIDEFQDTNVIQYDIVKILAGKHRNIFAVGDEDQCIYTWRGASIANIFDFQRDFPCKVFKLEQNYRSTSNILTVANRIIKGNSQRLDKKLWTENGGGEKVVCFGAATDGFEADYVARTIYELTSYGGYNYSDCAVLMRLNALTRRFEERFLQYGIPHRVYGGFKFFDRKEVKDVLAYARLSVNPSDDEALLRIINFPRRGIGEASIEKLRGIAASKQTSLYGVITTCGDEVGGALKPKLVELAATLSKLVETAAQGSVVQYFKYLLFCVLNVNDLFSKNDEDRTRLENLNELLNSVAEFATNNGDGTLSDYLQTVSLYSDGDELTGDNAVTVATVHSAKGLEFPVVFVVGLEESIFPSIRISEGETSSHIEEERRLMYVAATRAKKRLFLTYSKSRFLYGETKFNVPSRFLTECGLVEKQAERQHSEGAYGYDKPRRDSYGYGGYSRDGAGYGVGNGGMTSGRTRPSGYSQSQSGAVGAYKSDFGKTASAPKPASDAASKIKEGCTVSHKRLGKGKVIGIEKQGDSIYAKIDFERGGVMLLAVDFAPLTVVEE